MSGRLDGHVAIVTGGASRIGAATARRFVAEGASVVIADVSVAAGTRLAGELGASSVFVATDVTDEGSVAAAVEAPSPRSAGST